MSDCNTMSESEKKKEDWMNSKWRPMMGWLYMATCTFDFVIFPIMWSMLQSVMGHPVTQWQPLTLQGAGLYHIAMGAVLGLTAFGRTQEKLAGANNGGANTAPTGFGIPTPTPVSSGGFNQFGSASPVSTSPSGFGSTPSTATTSVSSSTRFGEDSTPTTMISRSGKPMPVPLDQPEI